MTNRNRCDDQLGLVRLCLLGHRSHIDGPPPCPRIFVIEHGPYRVVGDVEIHDADGDLVSKGGSWCLCRCGCSRNKPSCDVTHGLKGFHGSEAAEHGPISERRDTYPATEITVYDNRTRRASPGARTADVAHEWAAGLDALERLTEPFLEEILSDPILEPVFGGMDRLAVVNRQPGGAVVEHAPVPLWGWGEAPPFEPQPCDAPDAAECGRERYAEELAAKPRSPG